MLAISMFVQLVEVFLLITLVLIVIGIPRLLRQVTPTHVASLVLGVWYTAAILAAAYSWFVVYDPLDF